VPYAGQCLHTAPFFRQSCGLDAVWIRRRMAGKENPQKSPIKVLTSNGKNDIKETGINLIERKVLGMVFDQIKEMLAEQLDLDESKITMDSDIVEDLEADSLDVVDLVMSMEDEFGVEVPDEVIENFKTVGDVVRYIEENT
jgi:acyl carrier protein